MHEAIRGHTKLDFRAKMSVALKEASETEYWLEILHETGYLSDEQYEDIDRDCSELNRILIQIVKTSGEGNQSNQR